MTWRHSPGYQHGVPPDYAEFEDDGTLVFHGDAAVWDDLQVVMGQIKLPGVSDPAWIPYKGGYVLAFSKAADNIVSFTAQIPHGYKVGSDVEFHLHLAYPDNGAGFTRWNFTHSWASIGGEFPGETTVAAVDITSPEVQDRHQLAELAETIDGAGKGISSVLICSIQRVGTADNYDDVVYLVAADFHFEIDTVGSRQEIVK